MDDSVIKSKTEGAMLKDIEETFKTLRSISMKLNPGKCSFGMEKGKFLGVIVTNGGFKANPEKLEAVRKMPSPKSIKQVQTLNGRLVALNRFLSSHAEKSFPFVSTLRNCLKKSQFRWTEEAGTAFQEIKSRLEERPTLTTPKAGEPLIHKPHTGRWWKEMVFKHPFIT
ncbi:putative mitochondrial protein AtMg00860 [Bidens hawaiensis]|uniref:putative mitochondrial protein AtMg00860 n=1 Tax=Bidens hawaiensis TaxID=980011 RepID=UPI00404969CA